MHKVITLFLIKQTNYDFFYISIFSSFANKRDRALPLRSTDLTPALSQREVRCKFEAFQRYKRSTINPALQPKIRKCVVKKSVKLYK